MDDKGSHGGARPGAGRTRVRRRISKEAAKRLDQELAWLTEDVQDEILSELVLHAPQDLFRAAAECVAEMGGKDGSIPGGDDKPIII